MHVRTYVLVLEECWNGVIVVVYYNGVSLHYILYYSFIIFDEGNWKNGERWLLWCFYLTKNDFLPSDQKNWQIPGIFQLNGNLRRSKQYTWKRDNPVPLPVFNRMYTSEQMNDVYGASRRAPHCARPSAHVCFNGAACVPPPTHTTKISFFLPNFSVLFWSRGIIEKHASHAVNNANTLKK